MGKLLRTAGWFVALVASVATLALAGEPPVSTPSGAEQVFAAAPGRLLQIRSVVAGAGRQSSVGSGFLVGRDGLAITNYHVVSQVALEPHTYRLEYAAADGTRGAVELLAIDLANDLAVVRLDKRDARFFEFVAAETPGLTKGERLFSMGNPLDLGFTIVEGTYNGLVEHTYNERVHFTGALNPGMSGGPAVTADGQVVGVNVSKRSGGELVSFLVPGRFAAALLQRVRTHPDEAPRDFRAEIGRQLKVWQAGLYQSLSEQGFRPVAFGPYQAPETAAPWFNCWSNTNASAIPKPRASINSTNCRSDSSLFVSNDLLTGSIQLSHSHVTAIDLNQFQFAAFLSQQSQPRLMGGGNYRKWYTPQRCHEDFVVAAAGQPALRAVWCARGYRQFEGLYDISLIAVTEDRSSEALVSRLNLQAVGYDEAVALARRFLAGVQWTK